MISTSHLPTSRVNRALQLAVALQACALVAQAIHAWTSLPERVASHFDLAGRPDGWMSRDGFLAIGLGVSVVTSALFLALSLALPRLSDRWINLPHKGHWLAPERRAATLELLTRALLAMGCATQWLLLAMFHAVIDFNLDPPDEGGEPARLELSLLPMILYALAAVALAVWMPWRFRRPS